MILVESREISSPRKEEMEDARKRYPSVRQRDNDLTLVHDRE